MAGTFNVYLEIGQKKTFAGALDWPGWCRHGRDEQQALESLLTFGPRYARILSRSRLGVTAPENVDQLVVVERLEGNATTDFGAPALPPSVDRERTVDAAGLKRLEAILRAGWRAFDAAVEAARGIELAKGPRGGGRSLDGIVKHVVDTEAAYLSATGGRKPKAGDLIEQLELTRKAVLSTLKSAANGELPAQGPRGGKRWTARYFVRRAAWHTIAHVWEIERRAGLHTQ